MADGVRVACCQNAPEVGSPQRSAELAVEAIGAAVRSGARIVVLPELATSGYVFTSVEEAQAAALTGDQVADPWAPVVDTRQGRIGLAICYDIEFPELTRGLALAGPPTTRPR
jgi:5-aminopentanamidase